MAAFALVVLLPSTNAQAQQGECSSGLCGTPEQSGGGCGCGCGCSILIAQTDLGDTYQTADDFDNDGMEDDFDNCPYSPNTGQVDSDGDGAGDACDNAPLVSNTDQMDRDGDGLGDVIDGDIDGDGILNGPDNCPGVVNPTQIDTSGNGTGDACDADDDADGIPDLEDPCPKLPGVIDPSTLGCAGDEDLDGILDQQDSCVGVANPGQEDMDNDGLGDVCDTDMDNDGFLNNLDNAPTVYNPEQTDLDRDGIGDDDKVRDTSFCYVFDQRAYAADPSACLDPFDTFKVGAIAIARSQELRDLSVGDELELLVLSNRIAPDLHIQYTWQVATRPNGSEATVSNPRGTVSEAASTVTYEERQLGLGYKYTGSAPVFSPDSAGTYELRLEARLVDASGNALADPMFEGGPSTASFSFPLEAQGGESGGCSQVGKDTSLASLFVVLAGLFLVRRRRQ